MTAMTVIHVVSIRDFISADLEIRKSAITFVEKELSGIRSDDIRIDFSNIKLITLEFARQYLLSAKVKRKFMR